MSSSYLFLSHILDEKTPTYGNRNKFQKIKKSAILNGDVANDTYIKTTSHIGTHIDMPYHFYENGQTIEDFDINFWIFQNPLFIEILPQDFIIKDELLEKLAVVDNRTLYDILIVKTGICHQRDKDIFWEQNYGFAPEIANYLREKFPSIRVFGFDSISVSSFTNRVVGREAHKRFLDPKKPILLLEDMDLRDMNQTTKLKSVIVSPLRITQCDGLPCSVFGVIDD
ncbi:Metal-dependent hydrolase [hydrothermal vent metagenome]|uniref:Metal-dependent hydrolase n=1 Tax=hydrothermal vent metagenome TaxID=652676 RepID=A0A1W1D4P9_9ZZZZ